MDKMHEELDALYGCGWDDRNKGRDYDPRGSHQWQVVADMLIARQSSGQERGETVAYLCDGMRFKVAVHELAGTGIYGLPLELNGRWVALVAADDDCHLAVEQKPIAVLRREIGENTWFDRYPVAPNSKAHQWLEASGEMDYCVVYAAATAPAPSAAAVQVPEGWALVPKIAPPEVLAEIDYMRGHTKDSQALWHFAVKIADNPSPTAAPAPATVATEAVAQGYWQATDGGPNPNYQPGADEAVTQDDHELPLRKLEAAIAADPDIGVAVERIMRGCLLPEKAVAQGGGVDVEKVMALVGEYGAVMNHIGAGIGEGHDRDCGIVLAEIRALLASPAPAGTVGDGCKRHDWWEGVCMNCNASIHDAPAATKEGEGHGE